MTLGPLDEEAIFYGVWRSLEKHQDMSNQAAASTAGSHHPEPQMRARPFRDER